VFAAVLDAERGGRFTLSPEEPYTSSQRYVRDSNVLETTYTTDHGTIRVTDALTLAVDSSLTPTRELVRRVEGVAGRVRLAWRVEPRFGYGTHPPRIGVRAGTPVAYHGAEALAVHVWDAGDPERTADGIGGHADIDAGSRGMLAVTYAAQEPLILPGRDECEHRLDHTVETWRRWAAGRTCSGPWRDAVLRSALALKLLVYAPSGALAAAGTGSLPESIGGPRNWDYRYSWVRDSAFALEAFLSLGCTAEAIGYFWWLMHASQLTHPRLRVLYRLDGGAHIPERTLPLTGYRESAPVRIGNAAATQLQLDTYGELLQTAWLYATAGHRLDADIARRLAGTADLVCTTWRERDAGIWEVRSEPAHFTQSKMMCWVALDRALDLARRGLLSTRHAAVWRRERDAIAEFVETRCFSGDTYVRAAGANDLDASLLLGLLHGYAGPDPARMDTTVTAIQQELQHGPYVYRYLAPDGMAGHEGAFLACSFWLVEALARCGRTDQAVPLMDKLVGLANDVGLYSEEIDPDTGDFLGNLPQALSHLALISAACAIGDVAS
jgi:GH15 family glucan-1,4-alpha-glucosidase